MTKPTIWPVRPATTQISLGIRQVWSESLLSAWRYSGSLATDLAHSEDTDQTRWMPRLIWIFDGRTYHFVGFVMLWLMKQLWHTHLVQLDYTFLYDHILSDTRIAFKKASHGSLAYDLLSLINLQVKCNLPILRYNTDILMNSLGLKEKRICTLHFSVAICLLT